MIESVVALTVATASDGELCVLMHMIGNGRWQAPQTFAEDGEPLLGTALRALLEVGAPADAFDYHHVLGMFEQSGSTWHEMTVLASILHPFVPAPRSGTGYHVLSWIPARRVGAFRLSDPFSPVWEWAEQQLSS